MRLLLAFDNVFAEVFRVRVRMHDIPLKCSYRILLCLCAFYLKPVWTNISWNNFYQLSTILFGGSSSPAVQMAQCFFDGSHQQHHGDWKMMFFLFCFASKWAILGRWFISSLKIGPLDPGRHSFLFSGAHPSIITEVEGSPFGDVLHTSCRTPFSISIIMGGRVPAFNLNSSKHLTSHLWKKSNDSINPRHPRTTVQFQDLVGFVFFLFVVSEFRFNQGSLQWFMK